MDTLEEHKDRLIQELCPTVMVPVYSHLPELKSGYRYLMADSGLWIEALPPWGHFRLPLWQSPRPLPYGAVDEVMHVRGGRIPGDVINECVERAAVNALKGIEWAGWIAWSEGGGYEYIPLPALYESLTKVRYAAPRFPEGSHLVLDLHSHPFEMDRFSAVDDLDDSGGTRFSGVISFDGSMLPRVTVRLCIEGHFFDTGGKYETFSAS